MKINTWIILGAGLVIGAMIGYGYWYYIGCMSGSCSITSSPVNSTAYGAVLGVLTMNLFIPSKHDTAKGK